MEAHLGLQGAEKQFDLPSQTVGNGHLTRRQLLAADIRNIEMILARLFVPNADHADVTGDRAARPSILAKFGLQGNRDVDRLSLKTVEDVLELVAFQVDRAPSMRLVRADDRRMGVGCDSADEIVALLIDAVEQMEVAVA